MKIYPAYQISLVIFLCFMLFGLILDGVPNTISGLKSIVLNPDILITDYICVGGTGGAFFNAGLIAFCSVILLILVKVKPNGSTIMALWLMLGFGFFGKNIFNIWPLTFGVWLHSKYKKEPFLNYILIALLGTSLAPIVSQLSFTNIFSRPTAIFLGILLGIFCGFILPPLASNCMKIHQGYNLYNIGFASGLLGTLFMSIFRSVGINFEARLLWYDGSDLKFIIFFILLFLFLIFIGLYSTNFNIKNLDKIANHSGCLVTDYYMLYGNTAYINMGILGIFALLFVLAIGGTLTGPTIGAICTIVGFGAFGKNLKNIIPVMLGSCIASFLNIWTIDSPQMVLSILFSTTVAPIAGKFGLIWGIIAGFLHVCIVMNTSYLHGGLNLYNNGLAGGIVAIILVPIIQAFRKDDAI